MVAGRICSIACICILAIASDAYAERFPLHLKTTLQRFHTHIYNDQFDEAERLLDSLCRDGGPVPICHLYRAVLYQSRMMSTESYDTEKELYAVLDSLETDADSILASGGDSALAWWLSGNSHAFRSLFLGRGGRLFAALKHGLAARNAYGRGYEIDPTFHDIALGLGSYRYWKSVKTKAINWTPIFDDEAYSGLELLRLAADSAELSSDAATAALIWVYINEERYAEAIRLARRMRYRYPDGLTFLWGLGEAYYRLNDCRGAIDIYETILLRLKANPGNYYNIIEAAYYLSKCYRQLSGRWPEYVEKLDPLRSEIVSMPVPEDTRKRQEGKLKEILNR